MHLGKVVSVTPHEGARRLVIACEPLAAREAPGASINVNGACLTVVAASTGALSFDVVPETLSRTNLGALAPGDRVNLEPSLRAGDPLGGHLVYGHIDATTTIEKKTPEGPAFRIWSITPERLTNLICEKGFVALDGVSLTVASVEDGRFSVALIPETLRRTTFGEKGEGATLNLEADPLARYAASILAGKRKLISG